ncbi:hypothetical protein PILCRDRAFT_89151 [Piloderma croceum F 1598]|uniref:Uncharacterized protein n=1 Tax=Piloderma croceum (strain F 1598) TaxID=765440 RepID=A0A0C3FQJ8_PILCF|nr:hypothetical protein PILCRDRAFT_89151 [Piloderma croceum F 1598]
MDFGSYRELVDLSLSFERKTLDARLLARDSYLTSVPGIVGGYSFVRLFLKQIEAIQFASDWNHKGLQKGGKKYKTDFTRTIYQSRTGKLPPDTRSSSTSELKAFRAFKLKQRWSITSQNYLLGLYKEYSASVLMDPTWDIEHMSHSSKTFPLVLKMLKESRVLTSQSS